MLRKQLAFFIQQQCAAESSITLKRSHIHEFIAAYLGFASQAAMDVEGALFENVEYWELPDYKYVNDDSTTDSRQQDCILRARDLGYSLDAAEKVAATLNTLLREQALSFIDYASIERLYWDLEDLSEENQRVLEGLVQKGQAGAQFALAALYRFEEPLNENDGYWYRMQQSGRALTSVQKGFAEGYAAHLALYKHFLALLKQAASQGYAQAAYSLATHDHENAEFWVRRGAELGSPEAQSELATVYGESDWLERAAEGGDFDSLYELALHASRGSDEAAKVETHKWVHLAKLYGFDLTRTLVDNEEDYGPVFITFEGVWLPALSPELQAEAAKTAQCLFDTRNG